MICLLPNCCFLSETTRTIAIARALRERGAPLRILTQGGTHEKLISEAGFEYDLSGPPLSPERCASFFRSVPGIGDPAQSMWSDEELRSYARSEAAYFQEHGIRAAVTGWTLTALLSTQLAGIPLVTDHAGSFLPPVYERGLLPTPTVPLGLPLERLWPDRLRRRLFNSGVSRRQVYLSGFNRVAAELEVPGIPSFAALLLGDLTLVTDVPEVLGISRAEVDGWTPRDPSRYRPGTRLRYAGPIYAELDRPVPDRVERFLARPGPVAYVAITSSREEVVGDAIAALLPLGIRILVAATVHDLADLESAAVMIEGVLPSHRIMPRVDLAVIAGGQGSVQAALAAGLPIVGIPLQPEQDTNLALVERRGAALRVAEADVATAGFTRAARSVLTEPGFREQARLLQRAFAAVDGPGRAAELILELVAGSEHRASSHLRSH